MFRIKNIVLIAVFLLSVGVFAYLVPFRPVLIQRTLIMVETAKTPQQRSCGLQGRSVLAANGGMLFFFNEEGFPQFWMKDTFIPLDIAFIDAGKKILDIQEMVPLQTDIRYYPSAKAKYALEMNAGWFKKNNIHVGHKMFFW